MNVLIKVANKKSVDLDIVVESPKGSERHGKDWIQTMAHDYGYIEDTIGADGEEMDCFVGTNKMYDNIYVIEQKDVNGEFDEHKVMLGFSNIAEAKDAYFANYPEGWDGIKNISEIKADDFWKWYEGLDMKKNSVEEIFIRELKKKEIANPTRHITEDEFPKKPGMIVVYKPYGSKGKGYYYVEGKNKWDEKENMMNIKQEYKFSREGSNSLLHRGLHTYGTKKDNAVCECPDCYGGGRLGLFECRNCKGSGKVENAGE